jgi:ABC-type bacteriocin/lantibiotic exporter with double-glycine peptidase domain
MVIAGFDALVMAAVLLLLANIDSRSLPVGAFVSFIWSYGTFMSASVNLSRIISGAFALIPGWERAKILLQQVPEDAVAKRDPGILAGAIEMTGVMFRYSHEAPFALAGLSFKVNPGEFVALVGPSGSGKSTAMRLLLGTESPQGGAVLYDGVDLRYLDLDLVRRQIGVVLQNGRLVAGSIFENIIGSTEGTLADAWDAARQAGLEDDIKALPMGMHTILTEATAAFSGGQVQRMMIARALACKPRILLLDEATSALDNVTQSLVTESLARLAVTRIVIGHRLSTVKQADRILVIDRGRVVEQGSFEELMQQNGQFADLARRQLL